MKSCRFIRLLVFAALFLLPALPGQAQSAELNSEITLFAGGFMGDSFITTPSPLFSPVIGSFDDDFIGGFRLTYFFHGPIGVEGGVGFTPASILTEGSFDGGNTNSSTLVNVDTYIFNANLVAELYRGRVTPFVTAGVSAVHFDINSSSSGFLTPSETDFAWNAGGGVKFPLTPTVQARFDARYYGINPEFTKESSHFTELSGGVAIRFNF